LACPAPSSCPPTLHPLSPRPTAARHGARVTRPVLPPWTQSVSLHWRPELRFYEERIRILRELEDKRELRAFRVAEGSIDARIRDDDHLLSVHQSGLSIQLLRPNADIDRAWAALTTVVETIRPASLRRTTVAFQYVSELKVDMPTAISNSIDHLFSVPTVEGVSYRDWAVLMDITRSDGSEGQMEFGIVEDHEVPARLSRHVGRINVSGGNVAPDHWKEDEFPAVAVFADSYLQSQIPTMEGALIHVREFMDTARRDAGKVVESISNRLGADRTEEVTPR
jgi:hypothetical protein